LWAYFFADNYFTLDPFSQPNTFLPSLLLPLLFGLLSVCCPCSFVRMRVPSLKESLVLLLSLGVSLLFLALSLFFIATPFLLLETQGLLPMVLIPFGFLMLLYGRLTLLHMLS
jgi:hypothetical protein